MRLITWNCKGAFHRKHDFVAALRPDLLIVPECEKVAALTQPFNTGPIRSFEWFGGNPQKGLAVVSYGDYALEVHPSYDPRHQWIVPLSVSGPLRFVLFAVWTLPLGDGPGCYVRPLFEAFDCYQPLMDRSPMVWAGDFNAGSVLDKASAKHKFCDFVSLLGRHGLHSVYHRHRACAHGEETDDTFYLHHSASKGYHLDYVFAPEALYPRGIEVSVGSHADWAKRSDHAPLVCDFLEEATVA